MRPHRWQPARLPRPWDSPGTNTGVGCHFLLQCMKVKAKSLSHVRLLATPWTAAYQATLPMGFPKQEYWSGVPLPSPPCSLRDSQMSSKASVLWHSAFFIVQFSHPYMTTGKTIALTRWTFVGKVISLFFKMLSRCIIAFLPRSKCLLISWLQSPSPVILEPRKISSATVSTVPHLFPMK